LNTAKNRVHLDLRAAAGVLSAGRADPLGAECTRVVALNRLHAEPCPQPESWAGGRPEPGPTIELPDVRRADHRDLCDGGEVRADG